jgi:hypothetical protein
MFSLRKRKYCNTMISGKAGTGTAAPPLSTIPNYESARQARWLDHARYGASAPPEPAPDYRDYPTATLHRDCYTNYACMLQGTDGQSD